MIDAQNQGARGEARVLTIPNVLSVLRIALLPFIVRLYGAGAETAAFSLFALSALTDAADGFIARSLRQVSDLGKVLDPVADKLTQGVLLLCLSDRYPNLLPVALALAAKELYMAAWGAYMVRRLGHPLSAAWHGKATTVLLFAGAGAHMLLSLSESASRAIGAVCAAAMALSAILYTARYLRLLAREGAKSRREGDFHA